MNIPKQKDVSVHICLFNGRWAAILYGRRTERHLLEAMRFCRARNIAEGRPVGKNPRLDREERRSSQ